MLVIVTIILSTLFVSKVLRTDVENPSILEFKIPLIRVEDGRSGFVYQDTIKSIEVVEEIVAEQDNNIIPQPTYRYSGEILFLKLTEFDSLIQVYEFNIKSQSLDSITSSGELVRIDKPALQGVYFIMKNEFFKIEKKEVDTILSNSNITELDLLKYYTEK